MKNLDAKYTIVCYEEHDSDYVSNTTICCDTIELADYYFRKYEHHEDYAFIEMLDEYKNVIASTED